jgi:hypothetical protein
MIDWESLKQDAPTIGQKVLVKLNDGSTDVATYQGAGFMLCNVKTARSHGHMVGRLTDPYWVTWQAIKDDE